jgi:23S rRNA (guanine745-N1)-methyltransferase
VSGFDISRDAVKYAARRNANLSLAVASAYRMPTADSAFDMAVNMFSPLAADEILRTLRPGGIFIMAIPGENHLYGLKSAVYKEPYKNEVADPEISGFELVSTERISFDLSLRGADSIRSLFMMTPYAYRTRQEDKERVFKLESLDTEIEFVIFVYKKPLD